MLHQEIWRIRKEISYRFNSFKSIPNPILISIVKKTPISYHLDPGTVPIGNFTQALLLVKRSFKNKLPSQFYLLPIYWRVLTNSFTKIVENQKSLLALLSQSSQVGLILLLICDHMYIQCGITFCSMPTLKNAS